MTTERAEDLIKNILIDVYHLGKYDKRSITSRERIVTRLMKKQYMITIKLILQSLQEDTEEARTELERILHKALL